MNIALGIGTLLLGGWVMPDSQPQSDLPAPRIEQPRQGGRPDMTRTRSGSGEYSSQPRSTRQGGDEEPTIPMSPTDPNLQSPDSHWATPTQTKPSGQSGQSRSFGTRPYSGGGQMGSYPQRTGTRPAPTRTQRSYGTTSSAGRPVFRPNIDLVGMQQQTPKVEMGPRPQAAGTQLSKPFQNYQTPSGVSPYQSLYNFNPTSSISNNYKLYVRPQLDQQRANRTVGGQIRGLQSNSRLTASALQRLGKKADNIGGTLRPSTSRISAATTRV